MEINNKKKTENHNFKVWNYFKVKKATNKPQQNFTFFLMCPPIDRREREKKRCNRFIKVTENAVRVKQKTIQRLITNEEKTSLYVIYNIINDV